MIFVNITPAAMIIAGGRDDDVHKRSGQSFIGANYDWSGVCINSDNRATMISPSYFLTADHYRPDLDATMMFENSSGTTFEYNVDSYSSVFTTTFIYDGTEYTKDSDLRMGKLTSQVDSSIAKYSLATDGSLFYKEPLFLYGASNYVGTNELDSLKFTYTGGTNLGNASEVGASMILGYDEEASENEAYLQYGDSSSPSFAVRQGELILTGIHWAITSETDNPDSDDASIDTYTPFYNDQIETAMEEESPTFWVPEPSVLTILILALCISLLRRPK